MTRPDSSPPRGIHFESVTVVVDDGRLPRTVVDDVSFSVQRGEMVAVMGPSGSGKSTLVNVASGLVRPTRGQIVLDGLHPGDHGPAWWADRRRDTIGVVHQRLNLLAGLSALDNVAIALDLVGFRHKESRLQAMGALHRVGIAGAAATASERLSVGEQQRVAIARAIAGDRPVLLADEPSAALDRTSADEVTRLLAELAREGRAVLLVTHDSQQASWADRTMVLRDGRIADRIEPAPPTAGPETRPPPPAGASPSADPTATSTIGADEATS